MFIVYLSYIYSIFIICCSIGEGKLRIENLAFRYFMFWHVVFGIKIEYKRINHKYNILCV